MPNISSKGTYKWGLLSYFRILDVKPEDYFKEKRNYETDVETYFIKFSENGRPPLPSEPI